MVVEILHVRRLHRSVLHPTIILPCANRLGPACSGTCKGRKTSVGTCPQIVQPQRVLSRAYPSRNICNLSLVITHWHLAAGPTNAGQGAECLTPPTEGVPLKKKDEVLTRHGNGSQGSSSTATASTTTWRAATWGAGCKPASFSATWHVCAWPSSSCWAPSAGAPPCSSPATSTAPSNASDLAAAYES